MGSYLRTLRPLCVAVLDAGGHLIALQCEDGASNLRPQIAMGKASSALGLGVSSRVIAEMAAERPTFIARLAGLLMPRLRLRPEVCLCTLMALWRGP